MNCWIRKKAIRAKKKSRGFFGEYGFSDRPPGPWHWREGCGCVRAMMKATMGKQEGWEKWFDPGGATTTANFSLMELGFKTKPAEGEFCQQCRRKDYTEKVLKQKKGGG